MADIAAADLERTLQMTVATLENPAPVRVNSSEPLTPRPRPQQPAHVIRDDAEAIAVAHRLAAEFRKDSALLDREGFRPLPNWTPTRKAACGASRCPRPMVAPRCRTPPWP